MEIYFMCTNVFNVKNKPTNKKNTVSNLCTYFKICVKTQDEKKNKSSKQKFIFLTYVVPYQKFSVRRINYKHKSTQFEMLFISLISHFLSNNSQGYETYKNYFLLYISSCNFKNNHILYENRDDSGRHNPHFLIWTKYSGTDVHLKIIH